MAIDNSLYDSLQQTYFTIKEYLDNTQLGREHSPLILKQEELGELLESFDVEALEEQTKDIHGLHDQLNAIKAISSEIVEELNDVSDSTATVEKTVGSLEAIFDKIKNIAL